MTTRVRAAGLALLCAVGLIGLSACNDETKPVSAASSEPIDVGAPEPSLSPSEDPQDLPSAPAPGHGLRSVDWQNILAPGYACFLDDAVQLIGGFALVPSEQGQRVPNSNGPRYVRLSLLNEPVYGTLAGYGPVAAIVFNCSNNSGTADGALLYSVGVYGANGDDPVFISHLLPKNRPAGEPPTLVQPHFKDGKLVINETAYGPHDKTCCPSNKTTTTWTYSGGAFTS